MLPEDAVRLRHIRDAAREVMNFASGRRREDLDTDRQLLLAVVMDLGIVGEAATQVTQATRDRLPDVPWRVIIGMRNRLIHAYADINRDIVWTTVTDDLPPLVQEDLETRFKDPGDPSASPSSAACGSRASTRRPSPRSISTGR